MERNESLRRDVAAIREQSPLVHNITNYVVMNNTANALLAVGASPVMAHSEEESADMARLAGALVINVGTLSPEWVRGMECAMRAASEAGIPIVYDPVGAGATPYRNEVNYRLLSRVAPTIVKAIINTKNDVFIESLLESADSIPHCLLMALSEYDNMGFLLVSHRWALVTSPSVDASPMLNGALTDSYPVPAPPMYVIQ